MTASTCSPPGAAPPCRASTPCRASIDWSWNLISDPERALLRRLTVFAGGWTLEAAEAVCSGGDIQPAQVTGLLAGLVAKSLVMASRQPGRERRFRLHETILQYAQEKRDEAGEAAGLRGRHLNYYLELSRQAQTAIYGPNQVEWFDRLNAERGNLRAALEHASHADLEAGMVLSSALFEFWRLFDLREGLDWATKLVQNPESQNYPHARARARMVQGNILWNMQQFEAARAICEECLEIFRALGDWEGEYDALGTMGAVLQFLEGMEKKSEWQLQALALARSKGDKLRQGAALSYLGWDQRDAAQGRAYWEEAIPLLRETGGWRLLAETLGIFGYTILSKDNIEEAERLLDEAHEVNQKIHNREMEFVLTGKSHLCLLRGEFTQARAYLNENIKSLEEVGNRMGYLWGRARLANVALREGNVAEAQQLLIDVIHNFHNDRNRSGLAFGLVKMASLFVATGKPAGAASLIGWSEAIRKEIGDPGQRIEQEDMERDIAAIKKKIGAAAYKAAYQAGEKMTLDEAVALALENS